MQTYLKDKDVAERYSIHRVTVWRWIKSKDFPQPHKLMNSTRWALVDLLAWEENFNGK